ncbi:reverse transcriptase domain-containing protein, partial [Tanacetum coccineum]
MDQVTKHNSVQGINDHKLMEVLIKKYCPKTEVKKMEDEFYNLTIKGNGLKTYIRRFQELAVLCPNMIQNTEKLTEVFIGGLPRSIEGNIGLRFVSRLDYVLSQDWIAFCLKIGLRFVSRLDCVLSQDLIAFCLKTSCILSTSEDLHCILGKENKVNILKSIDERPFQMGTFRETLAERNEGALHLGLERYRVYSDLSPKDKD